MQELAEQLGRVLVGLQVPEDQRSDFWKYVDLLAVQPADIFQLFSQRSSPLGL